MKIAVNTRFLLPARLEGIGWFTYEIFKRLSEQHPEVEWIFIFDRPYAPHFIFNKNITPVVIGPPARHPVLWHSWFQWSLPRKLRQLQPDLFISPDGYLPLNSPCPTLAVIHDLNFEHHPENLPRLVQRYLSNYFPRFARKATRVATVSKYSARDIAETYQIDPAKIDLVYNGSGEFFHPLSETEREAVRNEFSGGKPYFLFIGALNPRKNITGMLKAYQIYRQAGGDAAFIIVGEKMFSNQEIEKEWQDHPFRDDIIFAGRLEGDGLNRILAASSALMFVSQFEGFGIPIVEAFSCEVPVITSTTTSMPEVAGEAALLCDPGNYQQIAEAMHQVGDSDIRNRLIAQGRERAKLFTWQRSAEMMWESLQKTLASVKDS